MDIMPSDPVDCSGRRKPTPLSSISTTSKPLPEPSRPISTVTSVASACLTTLCSASWTMRYTSSSSAEGSATNPRSLRKVTAMPLRALTDSTQSATDPMRPLSARPPGRSS